MDHTTRQAIKQGMFAAQPETRTVPGTFITYSNVKRQGYTLKMRQQRDNGHSRVAFMPADASQADRLTVLNHLATLR